jgi:hypothetical protein
MAGFQGKIVVPEAGHDSGHPSGATTMRTFRARTIFTTLLAAAAVPSCGPLDTSSVCILGPCYSAGTPQTYLLGFPIDRVDRSVVTTGGGSRGTLRVGESVRLVVVRSLDVIAAPAETLRAGLTWALRDSVVARISADGQGTGVLEARTPGVVGLVLVDGFSRTPWACDGTCWRVDEIVVVP